LVKDTSRLHFYILANFLCRALFFSTRNIHYQGRERRARYTTECTEASIRARDEKPKWHVLGALQAGR